MENGIGEIEYLTQGNAEFKATEGGFLSLKYAGKAYERVTVGRAFPLTEKDEFITVREPDLKAKEIGMIRRLTDFNKATAALLTKQLDIRYFMPSISKINSLKEEYGYGYFDVETDKGHCKFTVHIYGRSFVRLSDVRYIITDIDGNRFEIKDITRFSNAERNKLDLYL